MILKVISNVEPVKSFNAKLPVNQNFDSLSQGATHRDTLECLWGQMGAACNDFRFSHLEFF